MGSVYSGRRITGDFQQQIAFKLISTRLMSAALRERFLFERQALATLNHPHIARLLDGGLTEEGEPYLVMEYIEGARLDEYCERTGASVAAIVRLALQLCDAVSFVHRNLIVHRDLKPGNVLVDAEGRVKLLDFGAAKLLDPSGPRSEATRLGMSAFTPRYASPEQMLGTTVTAASDVYSLGVILYRLFTGRFPYDLDGLSSARLAETLFEAVPAAPELRGDLDAIVLKALRPKVEDRYASADALAADLLNYLEHRPVAARQGSRAYRVRKLLRRHAIALVAAASIALSLASGLIATVREGRIAAAQQSRAREGFGDVRRLANHLLFDFYDEVKQLQGSTDVQRRLVSQALTYLDGLSHGAAADPAVQLDLVDAYTKMGNVLGNPYEENLGDAPKALASLDKALRLAEDAARRRPGDTVVIRRLDLVRRSLGEVHFSIGDTARAIQFSRAAASSLGDLARLPGAALVDVQEAGATFDSLGDLYGLHSSAAVGDMNAALQCYRKCQALQQQALAMAPGNPRATRGLAIAYMKIANVQGDSDPALAMEGYQKTLALLDRLPPEARQTPMVRRVQGMTQRKISGLYTELGRPAEAIPYLESARDATSARLTKDPQDMRGRFDLATLEFDLAQTYEDAGKTQAAVGAYAHVLQYLNQLLTRDPANIVWLGHRAEALYHIGLLSHDERAGREALDVALKIAASPQAAADDLDRAAEFLLESDPRTALTFAARAVEKTAGTNTIYLLTLAKAQQAAGERTAARETARKLLALLPAPAPGNPAPRIRKMAEKITN